MTSVHQRRLSKKLFFVLLVPLLFTFIHPAILNAFRRVRRTAAGAHARDHRREQLADEVWMDSPHPAPRVAWFAHLGGFSLGLFVGILARIFGRKKEPEPV